MPRVDVWDIPNPKEEQQPVDCGYRRDLENKYEFDRVLGEGGFGLVRVVRHKSSGGLFACKSICKRLDVPNLSYQKQQQHLENIKREVAILRKLRGTLNVVYLEEAYEDDSHVHIVMEYCRGGELFHRIGKKHYSEKTVASYMRAVLRTLAQCHAHKILHRDIKPGNFMLLNDTDDSPLKAIDFGLAVFYDSKQLPRTDLGLEGTPWYMAPEVLSSHVVPASDVWAAGVMAYQLLAGRFPFDDWRNPDAPALSLVWKSILTDEPSFSRSGWQDISEQAKDFCKKLLEKDPTKRPSARDALLHPWLKGGGAKQRTEGRQLSQVVQRLQRYSQQNAFKRTVLDMIANELLRRHMALLDQEEQAAAAAVVEGGTGAEGADTAAVTDGPDAAMPAAASAGGMKCAADGSESSPPGIPIAKAAGSLSPFAAAAAIVGSAPAGGLQQSLLKRFGSGTAPHRTSLDNSMHGGGAGGSMHGRRSTASMRGSMSALEALRRARERKSYAEQLSALGKEPSAHGGQAASALGGKMSPLESAGSDSYKGPIKDPSAASAWDFKWLANRLALEGSAHGNPHAARLLRAANVAQAGGGAGRMEGTWHGPRTAGASPDLAMEQHLDALDRSWHGRAGWGLQGAKAGPRDSMESVSSGGPTPEDFQRFVEQTKRQRQEQRKVARLVLESSTHGGSAFYNSDANANITSPPGGDKAGAGADNQQHRQQQEDGHISTSHQQGGSQQVKDSKSSQQQQRERDSDGINSQGSGLLKKFKGVMKSLKMAGSNKDVASSCSAEFERLDMHSSLVSQDLGKTNNTLSSHQSEPVWGLPVLGSQGSKTATSAGLQLPAAFKSEEDNSLEVGRRGHGAYAALMKASQGGNVEAESQPGTLQGVKLASEHVTPSLARHSAPLIDHIQQQHATLARSSDPPAAQQQQQQQQQQEPPGTVRHVQHVKLDDVIASHAAPQAEQQQDKQQTGELPQQQQTQQQQQQQQQQEAQQAGAPKPRLRPKTAPRHVGYVEPEPADQLTDNTANPTVSSAQNMQPEPADATAELPSALSPPPPLRPKTAPKHVGFIEPEPQTQQASSSTSQQPSSWNQRHSSHSQLSPSLPISLPVTGRAGTAADSRVASAHDAYADWNGPLLHGRESPLLAHGGEALISAVQHILDELQFDQHGELTVDQLGEGLAKLGYRLAPSEVADLAREISGGGGVVAKSQFAASQFEWGELQVNHREEWLSCLRSTFEDLDADKDGKISVEDIMRALEDKLPENEVNAAIEDVLLEAAADEDEGLDFAAFKALVSVPSSDSLASLDQYDARLPRGDGASSVDGSVHDRDHALHLLEVVPETD